MAVFTDEAKEKVSNFFVDFYEMHKNDFLCQPGIWFFFLIYLVASVVTLMFGYVGYNHIDKLWPQMRGGEFGDSLVGVIGIICLTLSWWFIIVIPAVILIVDTMVYVGERIVKKREAIKNAQLEMWEV